MKRKDVNRDIISPMMKQYMDIKDSYEDAIVFYRIGDFYEMFFEDALTASKELELTLTGKSCSLDEKVPMCGIPFHAYLPYLEKLVQKGYKVAIVEQLSDPKNKGMVERGVISVVTKGTLMEESSLKSNDNNYIASIYDFLHCYVLSYADISTGEINSILIPYNIDSIVNEVIRIGASEVIVNNCIDRAIVNVLRTQGIVISIKDDLCDKDIYNYIYDGVEDLRIVTGIKHLLAYLSDNKIENLVHLQKVNVIDKSKFLELDLHSKRNLELTSTIRNNDRTYSLLWLLDKTKTAMGARLLKHYIENPLTDKYEIERRYDIISKLLTEFILKEELRESLNNVYDLERLSGRISYGNVNARDLIQLKNSLGELPNIKKILNNLGYDRELNDLSVVYNLINDAIVDDPPFLIKDGNVIKKGYSSELDSLKDLASGGKDFILKIEQEERERTGIKNLKVSYNRIFGYYIEISKGQTSLIQDSWGYIRKQTLANCERYIIPSLKEKEDMILNAEEKSAALEYELFVDVREKCKAYIKDIQKASFIISEVDCLASLAVDAENYGFVRPTLTDDRSLIIKDGRHPVVEKVTGYEYVANDVSLDNKTNIYLITGPNMSGKSTYMRMVAIIIVMAQMGSFVPCKSATIPIFDKIFTRIGASDDLVAGESTFMVEMKEACMAVTNATENSLILFDELGRGTATYDGIALAQSILEYIHDNIKAKTLFSTHYHELTALEKKLRYLKNVHVSAKEEDGAIHFLHKVQNGPVDKSYGIHVASLVNLPNEIIVRASDILNFYENKKTKKEVYEQTSLNFDFNCDTSSVLKNKLKEIDPLKITPLEALNILYDLKKEATSDDK